MKRLAILLLALPIAANAALMDFDFSGTFEADNDVLLFDFSVNSSSTVTIFSSSWISGDSGLGFDPILAIWDSSGNLIQQQDDGHNVGTTMSNGVSYSHGYWDTYFTSLLSAGDYIASITQFDNFANGSMLSDGFRYDDNPNFTLDNGYGTQSMFNGVWSYTDARTGDWEFHLLNVDSAEITSVPEPGTLALLAIGLFGMNLARRRKAA